MLPGFEVSQATAISSNGAYKHVYAANSTNAIVATPLSLGSATDQAYSFLFGTGFDAAKATAAVNLTIQ